MSTKKKPGPALTTTVFGSERDKRESTYRITAVLPIETREAGTSLRQRFGLFIRIPSTDLLRVAHAPSGAIIYTNAESILQRSHLSDEEKWPMLTFEVDLSREEERSLQALAQGMDSRRSLITCWMHYRNEKVSTE